MRFRAFIAVLLLTATAGAQRPLVLPADIKLSPPLAILPPGEDRIVPLQLNKPAPFDGQLFDTDTAIRWGFWLQQWQERYQLDMAHERNRCITEANYQGAVALAAKERSAVIVKDLNARLLLSEKARGAAEYELLHPGFFSSPGFYYGLGVATAVSLVAVGAWAFQAGTP